MGEHDIKLHTRTPGPDYARDWAAWTMHQVDLLKQRRFDELDVENLVDEVESLAARDFKAWVASIRLVLMHMLKWDHQPSHRARSWIVTIVRERNEIEDGLDASPSYAGRIDEAVGKAYRAARRDAAAETGLPLTAFPDLTPYPFDTIMNRELRLDDPE